MRNMATKCAAVLSAMAIVGTTAAVAAPAAFAKVDTGIVASAMEDFEYQGTYFTGDLYCPVGQSFSMEVTLGSQDKQYGTDGFTYEWYYSTDKVKGTNDITKFNWNKLSYTTKKVTIKMTDSLNGAHIYAVKVNKTTGERTNTPMRTVSSNAATAQFGAATAETENGTTYVTVPVKLTGLLNRQISAATVSLKVDPNVFEAVSFDPAVSGLSGLDNFVKTTGEYRNSLFNATGAVTLGTDNVFGEFVLKVKSGAKYDGSKLTLDLESPTLTGNDVSGNIVYGIATATTTLGGSSTSKYPVVKVQTAKNALKLSWNAVEGAEKYCIAYYSAGKWKVLAQAAALSFTKTGVPAGTYKIVVGARFNGQWDTSNINKRAITVTIPG